ncbi:MAG TPA: type IX secretion system membrane protein PorP/SprF, partial [Saprospiraceae bacterium]|nr:type IX secretion system membrane protein PorP/SprF [Saprospiraceae bacterium]
MLKYVVLSVLLLVSLAKLSIKLRTVMLKKSIVFYIFVFLSALGYGQDAVFSQYYAAPVKFNPAFTGLTQMPLINLNYRNQWPGFQKAYVTYNVGYSQFFEKKHSGVGLYVQADNAGNGLYVTNEVKGLYAYQLEPTKDIFLKLGIEAGVMSNHVGWEKLLFPDDIDPKTGGSGQPVEVIDPSSKTYLDIGAGVLLYNKHFYVGYAMSHLNTPNNQLLDVS